MVDKIEKLLLCDCEGSQKVDRAALADATGLKCSKVYSELCIKNLDIVEKAIKSGDTAICCEQQSSIFDEIAADIDKDSPIVVDIRDRAGWTVDKKTVVPKMAALTAEALMEKPIQKTKDVTSQGRCLIFGDCELVLEAAQILQETLSVTALLDPKDGDEILDVNGFDVVLGKIKNAKGSFGSFTVVFDNLQELVPSGRGPFKWTQAQDGATSSCDIILDLSKGDALFPASEKRDGYIRADVAQKTKLTSAILNASQLQGTFEKSLYIKYEASVCAHSRAEKPACSNCINVCPTGAIVSSGETVTIDPGICAGCGACAAVCPSGAIEYEPGPISWILARLDVIQKYYKGAGGKKPFLLVHDDHGRELISFSARYGDGLPSNVIPMQLDAIATFGHAEALAAHASGFEEVFLLTGPKSDTDTILGEAEIANAIFENALRVVDVNDPLELSNIFEGLAKRANKTQLSKPMGSRRQVTRVASKTLNPEKEILPLPDHAPYGAVLLDNDSCTLCLSCVSLCPSGALGENPDLPQLRFQEDACLQCGLCSNICPENAISYEKRLNLSNAALEQTILKEEEPFACIECGSLFGVKSSVERIIDKLAGKHSMFSNSDATKLIQMCDDCRINAQYHSDNNPFAGGERPKVRTTEDYLSKRKDH